MIPDGVKWSTRGRLILKSKEFLIAVFNIKDLINNKLEFNRGLDEDFKYDLLSAK